MHSFVGELAGAGFVFETDSEELGGYAASHLAPLCAETIPAPPVSVTLRWHEGQPPSRDALNLDLDRCMRVDRDVYVCEERLYWFRVDDLRDLHLRFRWNNGRLEAEGDFYFRVGNTPTSDRLRRLLMGRQVTAMRRRRLPTLIYYLVYYPCWWWLEHTRDLHPIHAAGVEIDGKVVLLAGASGIGKSTLSVVLASKVGARFLADSFVLHAGKRICAVPEPVLLDDWSRRFAGAAVEGLESVDHQYMLGRGGYQFPAARRAPAGQAGLLIFPRRTADTYIRRLSPDQAHQRLSAGNMIINDLRRYFAFAAVLEHLVPSGLVAHREANLARLAAEVPSYEMGLPPTLSAAEASEHVDQLLAGHHLRVVAQ